MSLTDTSVSIPKDEKEAVEWVCRCCGKTFKGMAAYDRHLRA